MQPRGGERHPARNKLACNVEVEVHDNQRMKKCLSKESGHVEVPGL